MKRQTSKKAQDVASHLQGAKPIAASRREIHKATMDMMVPDHGK